MSSSCDFHVHGQRSQIICRFSRLILQRFDVLAGLPATFPGVPQIVASSPMSLQICRQRSEVHLKATAWVLQLRDLTILGFWSDNSHSQGFPVTKLHFANELDISL